MTQTPRVAGVAPELLLADLRQLIDATRQQTTVAVNMGLTLLYWRVGQRINAEVLQGERAAYGEQVVATLSQQLTTDYGRSFGTKNLRHMMRFAEVFPDENIGYALSRHLSWTHFRALLYLDKPLQHDFYAEMCRVEGWSTRVLAERVDAMLYERTALSKKPDDLIRLELAALRSQGEVAPALVLKDSYLLDFLGLQDRFLERDLEDAILRELETFLLELGAGFSFVARQKRIQLDGDDFYLDLLFYNRKLRRLVVVELKQGSFKPEYKGQMELYDRGFVLYLLLSHGFVDLVDSSIALAQRNIRFRMKQSHFVSRFALYAMLADYFQSQLGSLSTGSTAEGLKASKMSVLRLIAPPLAEQTLRADCLDKACAGMDALIEKAELAMTHFAEFRKALITAAVTGKIDVCRPHAQKPSGDTHHALAALS